MDRHTESGWKPDPTAARKICEMNFTNYLTAFSWKNAGTNFLISEDAYEQVGHEVEVNQCPPWEVRGKTGVFQLYEVVGAKLP